jgi:hypothetical protein
MDRKFIRDTMRFWDTFPSERKTGDAAKQLEAEIRTAVDGMGATARVTFAEIARRQYAEQEATKASVASRASALLLFVGVITTGTTVVGASIAAAHPVVLGLVVVVGGCLLYACLAVAFLAVRAQEVATWVVPAIFSKDGKTATALTAKDAVEHAVSYEQNKAGVSHLVAYLADAQRWARRAVILVVLLAILSVIAAATKPPPPSPATAAPTANPTASPAPVQQPSATPIPRPSPVPSTP